MTWYLLTAPAVVAVCSLIRWIYWVRFNRWLFTQTKDPAAFERAARIAEAYRPFTLGQRKQPEDGQGDAPAEKAESP